MQKYSIKDKRNLIEIIRKMNKEQHIEIFKLLYYDQVKFTENINGIFINFHLVRDETIEKIETFINYCKNKQEELEKKNNDAENQKILLEEDNQ